MIEEDNFPKPMDKTGVCETPSLSVEEWEALIGSIGVPVHVISDEDTRRENLYEN
ncbi:MAG: hypothetical protein ABIY70_24670 [Capsulimonas sp.]|uniref:hypothetical protein n=1 Tax=Capsulimonas sp. TaxID=2494211 RepID=UPI003263F687